MQKKTLLDCFLAEAEAVNAATQNIIASQADVAGKGEGQSSIYREVLAFPKGTEHVKYFYKNPHPDRFSGIEAAITGKFNQSLNVNYIQRRVNFESVKRYLYPRLSEVDKLILLMPDKMQAMLDKCTDEDYRTAFTHLRDSFCNYFSSPISSRLLPEIQWIDYHFATNYEPARLALQDLTANLFNAKAAETLVKKLQAAGAFGKERKEFYFWNTDPHNWSAISYQSRPVQSPYFGTYQLFGKYALPPQYLALGNHTINAIPEGYVQPMGNGDYRIYVTKVYYFINDMFNFDGEEYLGPWNLDNISGNSLFANPFTGTHLLNSDFRYFQRLGYGRSFPVLSRLHEVDNFQPRCLEYTYAR